MTIEGLVLRPTAIPQVGGVDKLRSNLLVGKNRQMLDEIHQVIAGLLDPLRRDLLPGSCRSTIATAAWTTMAKLATTPEATKASVAPSEADGSTATATASTSASTSTSATAAASSTSTVSSASTASPSTSTTSPVHDVPHLELSLSNYYLKPTFFCAKKKNNVRGNEHVVAA
jgi:cobalamin biosynthesis Mg chelatase CobN